MRFDLGTNGDDYKGEKPNKGSQLLRREAEEEERDDKLELASVLMGV
jgi:hypothetical protein